MNPTYKVQFGESAETYADDRTFTDLNDAIRAGWAYADNKESIAGVAILQMLGDRLCDITPIDFFPRPAPEVKVTAPKRAGYVGYLAGFDVTWNDPTDLEYSYRIGRVLDTDTFGMLVCRYVYRSIGETDDEGPINSRVDGPILFFTWTNLPVLTVLDKQPTA